MSFKEALHKAKTKAIQVKNDAETWIYNKTRPVAKWVREHPNETATIVVAVATTVVPMGMRAARDKREADLRDRRVYDPKEGRYIYLRRKATNTEWLEVERLEKEGMSKTAACMNVGLIR